MSKTGQNVAIAGAVAVGAYLLLTQGSSFRRVFGLPAQPLKNAPAPIDKVTEVLNQALPSQVGYGWRYFTDGTSISPDGKYYLNGQLVWSPS